LHWALDRAISTPHEQFCHCDIIDVRAVVDAAQTSTNAALLLAKHVATHGDADAVRRALDRLVRDTHHLGSLTTSDAQISHSQWRRIAIDIDALTPRLTTLAGDFYGYGTGRLYA
jgi:hypothetical protein